MKKSIRDHLWNKIQDLDTQGRNAAEHKLKEVVELGRKISHAEGGDVANNVMDHGLIEVALLRCLEIQDKKHDGLCYDDLQINFRYADMALKRAEQIIDTELAYLDL